MAPTTKTIAATSVGGVVAAAIAFATPFIMQHEGLTLKAKPDVGTTQAICYGHDGVPKGTTYTVAQCQAILKDDINTVTTAILTVTPSLAKHQNQLAATIDFSYNVGVGAYATGSVARDFKAGNLKAGCAAMLLYDHVNGKVNQSLLARRKADYAVCMRGL
jgi:lysozyme